MEGDARNRDGAIEDLTDQVVTLMMDQALLQTELDALDESRTALRQAREELETKAAEQSSRIRLLEEEQESDKVLARVCRVVMRARRAGSIARCVVVFWFTLLTTR